MPRVADARAPILQRRAEFERVVRDVHGCHACVRMAHCHVLGDANGPLDARVLFVGEAPGRHGAALTGVPLTRDESGRRFDAFLAHAGLRRDEVFVTNAVLCNPLDAEGRNRTPSAREIARCGAFLSRTIDAVAGARVVVALGRVALEALRAVAAHDADLGAGAAAPAAWCGRMLVPLYHPGRQSTLHRGHALQVSDWRRLGEIVHREQTNRLIAEN